MNSRQQDVILFSLSYHYHSTYKSLCFQSSGYVGTNILSKLSKNIYSLDSFVGMTFDLLLTLDRIELKSVFNNFNGRLKIIRPFWYPTWYSLSHVSIEPFRYDLWPTYALTFDLHNEKLMFCPRNNLRM